jgi:predicted metal-dependent hydrolase
MQERPTMECLFENIGPVRFIRTKRSRYIKITVRPFNGVRVSYPYYSSRKQALAFVDERRDWLLKNVGIMREYEKAHAALCRDMPRIELKEAKRFLTDRVNELSRNTSFFFTRISVRTQKTLWGSCSSKNAISLNKQLLVLPPELQDYVIYHELVHTRIKNHSKRFWDELCRYVPDAKERDKKLRRFHPGGLL